MARTVSLDILRARVTSEVHVDASGVVSGTRAISTHLDRTQAKVKQTVDQFGYLALSLKRIATYSAIFTFFGGMARLLGQVTELQLRQAEVSTLVDTKNKEMARSFETVKNAILDIDPHLGNAIDLTKGLYEIMSAGVNDPVEALKLLELSAKYAKVGLTDLATASATATSILKAYGLTADDMREKLDMLFGAVQEGKFHTADLNDALGKILPTAAAMGVSIEEVGMALATLSQRGLDANQAATALNRMMLAFLKPLDKTKSALNKLDLQWGRNAFATRSFGEVMEVVRDGMQRYGDLLPKIFTRQRGLRGAFILTGSGLDDYNRMLEKNIYLTEGAGVVEEGLIKIKQTLSSEIKAMQAEILKTAAAWMKYTGTALAVVRTTKDFVIMIMKAPQFLGAYAIILTRINLLLKTQAVSLASTIALQRVLIRERITQGILTAEQGEMYGTLEVARQGGLKHLRYLRMMRIGFLGVLGALLLVNAAIDRWGERLERDIARLIEYGEELYNVHKEAENLGLLMEEIGIGDRKKLGERAEKIGYQMIIDMMEGAKQAGLDQKTTIVNKVFGSIFGQPTKAQDWASVYRKLMDVLASKNNREAVQGMSDAVRELAISYTAGEDVVEKHGQTLVWLINLLELTAKAQRQANQEAREDSRLKPLLNQYNRDYLMILRDLPDALKEMHPEDLAGTYDLEKLKGMRDALASFADPKLHSTIRQRLEDAGYDLEKYAKIVETMSGYIDEAIGLRKTMEWNRSITEFTRLFTEKLDKVAPGVDKIKQAAQGMADAWDEYKTRGIASVKRFVKDNREWLEILKLNWKSVPDELKPYLERFTSLLDAAGKKLVKAREKALKGIADWGTDMKSVLSDVAQYENRLYDKKYANLSLQVKEENRLYQEKLDKQLGDFGKYHQVSLYMRAAYFAQLAALSARQSIADKVAEADRIKAVRDRHVALLGSEYEYNFEKLQAAKIFYAQEVQMITESKVLNKEAAAERLRLAREFWGLQIAVITKAMSKAERYIAILKQFGNLFSRMASSFRDMFEALRVDTDFTRKFVSVVETIGKAFLNVSGAIRDAERAMKSWSAEGSNFISKLGKVATVADAVVTVVTSLITVIAQLFQGKTTEEKAAAEAERIARELDQMAQKMIRVWRIFGELSESVAKAVGDLRQKGIPGWLAELKLLNEIMRDIGINVENFGLFAEKLSNVLYATADGFLKSYEGAEIFGKAFKQLVDFAKEHGIEGHKSLLDLIRLTKELGIEVKEVTEYINEQLTRAAGGLAKAVLWVGKSAVEAYNEIQSLTKEKKKLLREIGRIQKQMEKYGMGSEEYIAAQEEIDELMKQIRKLDNQMRNHQEVIDAVSNATKNSIRDLGIIAAETFNAMVGEGIPLLEILDTMSEGIFALIERYKALGMEVPNYLREVFKIFKAFRDNPEFFEGLQGLADMFGGLGGSLGLTVEAFKALNREARRYYKLLIKPKEEGGMGFGDEQAIRLMYPVLQKMWWYAEQYGMKLPKWAREAIQKAKDLGLTFEAPIANQQLDALKSLIEGDTVRNKTLDMMKEYLKKIEAHLQVGYATGTPEIKRTHFARVHSGEAVIPENIADTMREFFSGRGSSGGLSGGGGASTLIVNLDGRQVYKGMIPHIREGARYGDFELAGQGVN